jgi:hypothetical protein
MIELLVIVEHYMVQHCAKLFCAHISFLWLKSLYEDHLTKSTNLENVVVREEERYNYKT